MADTRKLIMTNFNNFANNVKVFLLKNTATDFKNLGQEIITI